MEFRFTMPLHVIAKGKKYSINLNHYRNWHYRTSSVIKKTYQTLAAKQLIGYKFPNGCKIRFILIRPDKRRVDRSNFLSVHEKFFCDALVINGCLPDDNDKYIHETSYITGNMDKKAPRVEIVVYDTE